MAEKRGRKSAGDLSVVRAMNARMDPPEFLSIAEAAEWTSIMNSLPADYFRPGDAPLLGAYCVAIVLHKQARKEIQDHGITYKNEFGKRIMNPAATILQMQAGTMAQLSVKLRLAPSSRVTAQSAGANKNKATAAGQKRPWDTDDDDDAPAAASA